MAPITINRAPWNALIDDSGQNLDGSLWDKAAIKTVLLDPIDAALAQLPAFVPWTNVAFNVANFWPGLTADRVTINCYAVANKTMVWILQLNNAQAPAPAAAQLVCQLPGAGAYSIFGGTVGVLGPVATASDGGAVGAFIVAANAGAIAIQKQAGGNWIGPSLYAFQTIVIALA